jgi:hypothetical protein
MNIPDFLIILLVYVFGTLISLVITGLMANKFIIKKVMQNEDVKDLIKLFREGKDYLKAILENQNGEH